MIPPFDNKSAAGCKYVTSKNMPPARSRRITIL